MRDTKEQILQTALRLFAEAGVDAVSVSDIAGALGITKGALYRHYRSKRDIFDSILARMERRDAEQAQAHDLPEGSAAEMEQAYESASLEDVLSFSKAMFRYWTEDAFAARFRRMLSLERYRSAEMGALFQQYLAGGPVEYLTELFAAQGLPEPEREAAAFYGPMFLLYSLYDAAEDRAAVTALLDRLLEDGAERLRRRKETT